VLRDEAVKLSFFDHQLAIGKLDARQLAGLNLAPNKPRRVVEILARRFHVQERRF
jgi:GTP cyclohydrolase I